VAGPATLHRRFANEYAIKADLPSADLELLGPLSGSQEYRAIRHRLTDRRPVDCWLEDGLHYFVFALLAADGSELNGDSPTAVFAVHPDSVEPVSAVVVTPDPAGEEAEIVDLREPGVAYTAPLPEEERQHDADGTGRAEVEPAASPTVLIVLQHSPVYGALEDRLASSTPIDTWQEGGLHFYAFELLPPDGSTDVPEPPTAVFAVHPRAMRLVSAVVVTPSASGGEPETVDFMEQLTTSGNASLQEGDSAGLSPEDESANDGERTADNVIQAENVAEESVGENISDRASRDPGVDSGREQVKLENGLPYASPGARSWTVIEQSDEYRSIETRLAYPQPVDSWQEDGLYFHVFELVPAEDAEPSLDAPSAVFAVRPDPDGLVAAVVVTPRAPEITDLRHLEGSNSPMLLTQVDAPSEVAESSHNGATSQGENEPQLWGSAPAHPPAPRSARGSTEATDGPPSAEADVDDTDRASQADSSLLNAIERSEEYAAILGQLADPQPIDSWLEDGLSFFVFQLHPGEEAEPPPEPPVAVFAMRPESIELVSAVLVTPESDGKEPRIDNLRGIV
jgi:hypothetical protein